MEIENSVEYESPKFEFEKMMLTKKVAAVCWGYPHIPECGGTIRVR